MRIPKVAFSRAKWLLVLLFILFSIQPGGIPEQRYLPNDAYVWQRQWTPAVAASLAESSDLIRAWHVLAAEADPHRNWSFASVDWTTLKRSHRPVIFVVRIDGQLAYLDQSSIADAVASMIGQWRRSGLPIIGIEIDYDCGTARRPWRGPPYFDVS
jgi:hypothetical protein